jgi:hypothetical protein
MPDPLTRVAFALQPSRVTPNLSPKGVAYARNAEAHPTLVGSDTVPSCSTSVDRRPRHDLSPLETISMLRAVLAQGAALPGPALQTARQLTTLDWIAVFGGSHPPATVHSTSGARTPALIRNLVASVHTNAVATAVMIAEIPRLCRCNPDIEQAGKSALVRDAPGSNPQCPAPVELVALVHDCCRLVGVGSLTERQLSQVLQGLGYTACVPWGKAIEQEIWIHHFAAHQT